MSQAAVLWPSPAYEGLMARVTAMPSRQRPDWAMYESFKRELASMDVSPKQYEAAAREIARVCGV